MKQHLTGLIRQALDQLASEGHLQADLTPQINIDRTRDKSHGDLASNVALILAKGAGMIEPNMATMLAYFFTDAALPAAQLGELLPRVAERTVELFACHHQGARIAAARDFSMLLVCE